MKITSKKYAQALYEATQKASKKDLQKIFKNFLTLLNKHLSLGLLPKILKDYSRYYNEKEGIIDVLVQTAFVLTEKEKQHLSDQLENYFAKKPRINYVENKNVISGIVIKTDNYLIDASLKRLLDNCRQI